MSNIENNQWLKDFAIILLCLAACSTLALLDVILIKSLTPEPEPKPIQVNYKELPND